MMTQQTSDLFYALARDAANWNGEPMLGGNVGGSKEDRGYVTAMKKEGLITTFVEGKLIWVRFTPAGKALAAERGIKIED